MAPATEVVQQRPGVGRRLGCCSRLNVEVQSAFANGLRRALGVPSGGLGMVQSPLVAVIRLSRKKAPRQPGSRQELAIMEPFHSGKIWVWQPAQRPGALMDVHWASYGGG